MPATIASAVPTVGTRAADPGKGVSSVKTTAAAAIAAIPAQPRTTLAAAGVRASVEAQTATVAPRPSSHARVNGEKYASVGAVDVRWIDQASEAVVSTSTTPRRRRWRRGLARPRRPRTAMPNSAIESSRGQTT
jgi:hypothetical protein